MNSNNLKIAVITGAGKGIGLAIVKEFLHLNYVVYACTKKDTSKLKELKESLLSKKNLLFVKTFDINDHDGVKKNITQIYKDYKKIDALINCAGEPFGSMFNLTRIDDLKSALNVNFISQIYITQICSRFMCRAKSGTIVYISSVSSLRYDPGTLAYGASKAAINYATKVISKELAPFNIRVNCVAPGITNTEMLQEMDEKAIELQLNSSAIKKIAEPHQIASVVSFLCSEKSTHITGQIFRIDGGQ